MESRKKAYPMEVDHDVWWMDEHISTNIFIQFNDPHLVCNMQHNYKYNHNNKSLFDGGTTIVTYNKNDTQFGQSQWLWCDLLEFAFFCFGFLSSQNCVNLGFSLCAWVSLGAVHYHFFFASICQRPLLQTVHIIWKKKRKKETGMATLFAILT